MNFNRFPVELHHQILSLMDPEGILALRKTSKYFLALTHDPRLWTTVYDRMRQTHPLSCSQSEFAALSSWKSERLLVRASKTEKLFQTFREHAQYRIFPTGQTRKIGRLEALSFLSERFLLSVDDTTAAYVWDMSKLGSSAEAPDFPCTRLMLARWRFVTYSMTTDHSTLYVVFEKGTRAHIFTLSLPSTTLDTDEPKLSFRDVAYFYTHGNHVMSIDADSCLVLMELYGSTIEVVDWRTKSRSSIHLHQETTEVLFSNRVLALRICGPYILCLRRQSVDAYPIPLQFLKPELSSEQPLPVLQHTMPGMAFTGRMSLSRVHHSRFPSGNVYTLCALAEEKHGGTYHYQVQVHTMPLPSLSVRLLGFDSAHADRRISAWGLGLSGLRGVRAFTPNSSGERDVVAFTIPPSQYPSELFPEDNGTLDMPPEIAPRFVEQVVGTLSPRYLDVAWPHEPHDLNVYVWDDGVIECAVSEFTGRIALGWRAGMIVVL